MELIPDKPKNPDMKQLSTDWTLGHEGHLEVSKKWKANELSPTVPQFTPG